MKRVFIFLFVGMLLVFQPIKAYAEAGTVAVVGGSIATGGLSAAAFGSAALTGPAVVIVFAGLLAAGMNVRLTQASQQAGMTKTEFLKSKIQEFCNEANITLGVFNKTILEDAQVMSNGLISLGTNARKQIVQLGNWLFESNQVYDSTATPSDQVSLANCQGVSLPSGTVEVDFSNGARYELSAWQDSHMLSNVPCYGFAFSDYKYIIIKVGPFYGATKNLLNNSRSSSSATSIPNTEFYYRQVYINNSTSITNHYINNITLQQFLTAVIGQNIVTGMAPTDDTMTGKETDWTQNKDRVLDPSTYLNPGLNPGLSIPQDKSISIDVPDYLDAIGKILDGLRNPSIPGIDDATHMPVDIPYDDTVDPAPTIEDPTLDPTDPTPVINPSEPAAPDLAVAPFEMDLKGLFPFCIPFDVVDMLKMLKADPVAPVYTVNWNIPIINQTLSFTIDLTPFNSVASILRTMEIIAFCIGLAFVTRSMFIRG